MKTRLLCPWLLLAISACSWAQKVTLDEYVNKHRAELAGNSPLVYLDGLRLQSSTASLAAFKRKAVTVGTIKAVVPITMVKIDDSFSQKPDLYEGLDMRSKVIYLMATLSEQQIKLATTKGIGFGSLNSEQQLVLNSILPKKFEVERREAQDKRYTVLNSFVLTEQQRKGVLIKFSKTIDFDLPLEKENGYCQANTMDHVGIGNTSGFARVLNNIESGPDEIFGIKVRSNVPNTQKPSHLEYQQKAWDFQVSFAKPVSIEQALSSIGQTARTAIFADPRVAKRVLTLTGQVRAGDLLAAIAQMVTGTYRKVGPDFVLTSDLTGLGSRKVRFDQWEADVRKLQAEMSESWMDKVKQSSMVTQIKTNPRDPFQPSDRFNNYLNKESSGLREPIPDDLIDDGVRRIVDRFNTEYRLQPVTTKGMRAESSLSFNFVLPSGEDLFEPSGNLGRVSFFGGSRQEKFTLPPPPTPSRTIPSAASVALAIRSNNKEQILHLIENAAAVGMTEVWLETMREDVLQAAIEAGKGKGIEIRLVVRPWLNGGQDEIDQNILGDTAASLAAWAQNSSRMVSKGLSTDLLRSKSWPENSFSPDRRPESWAIYAQLVRNPGLAGVVICDPQTPGYEPKFGEGFSVGSSPSDLVSREFGYTNSMRLAFLRANSVDPIDLVPRGLMSSVNVNPDFFQDMELMGFPRTYGNTQGDEFIIEPFASKWQDFRAKTMIRGLANFKQVVMDKAKSPLVADLLPGTTNKYASKMIPILPANTQEPFTYDESGPGSPFGAGGAKLVAARILIDGQSEDELKSLFGMMSRGYLSAGKRTVCFDLTRLTHEEASKFVSKWFEPRKKSLNPD